MANLLILYKNVHKFKKYLSNVNKKRKIWKINLIRIGYIFNKYVEKYTGFNFKFWKKIECYIITVDNEYCKSWNLLYGTWRNFLKILSRESHEIWCLCNGEISWRRRVYGLKRDERHGKWKTHITQLRKNI